MGITDEFYEELYIFKALKKEFQEFKKDIEEMKLNQTSRKDPIIPQLIKY